VTISGWATELATCLVGEPVERHGIERVKEAEIMVSVHKARGHLVAVVRRETGGWRWPLLQFAYMGVLAYAGAFVAFHLIG